MDNRFNLKTSLVLAQLSNAITQIINTYYATPVAESAALAVPPTAEAKRRREESTWLAIYLTLSRKYYRDKLLFKNFADPEVDVLLFGSRKQSVRRHRVCKEAKLYVEEVLLKRLQLANKQVAQPTALHNLLCAYLQQSWHTAWHSLTLTRSKALAENVVDAYFQATALGLRSRSEFVSEVSSRRLAEFGPYCLSVGANVLHLAEELNLAAVFAALPVPLQVQPPIPRHKSNALPNTAERLKGVLESLNARYGHLVACGLPPELWLTHTAENSGEAKQLTFSDQQLRELTTLLRAFKQKRGELCCLREAGVLWDEAQLFKSLFKDLQAVPRKYAVKSAKTYAGFAEAEACYQFYRAFIKPAGLELKQTFAGCEDEAFAERERGPQVFAAASQVYAALESGIVPEADYTAVPPEAATALALLAIPDQYPQDFNPVTAYAWRLFMQDDQFGLHAGKAQFLLTDRGFRQLIAQFPQLNYQRLSEQALLARLRSELSAVVLKHLGDVDYA